MNNSQLSETIKRLKQPTAVSPAAVYPTGRHKWTWVEPTAYADFGRMWGVVNVGEEKQLLCLCAI